MSTLNNPGDEMAGRIVAIEDGCIIFETTPGDPTSRESFKLEIGGDIAFTHVGYDGYGGKVYDAVYAEPERSGNE